MHLLFSSKVDDNDDGHSLADPYIPTPEFPT